MSRILIGVHPIPPKSMMHIAYSPYFHKVYKFRTYFCKTYTLGPFFPQNLGFLLNLRFFCYPRYFEHDAFMYHALHLLGALENTAQCSLVDPTEQSYNNM